MAKFNFYEVTHKDCWTGKETTNIVTANSAAAAAQIYERDMVEVLEVKRIDPAELAEDLEAQ